jgi:hypothetical protein
MSAEVAARSAPGPEEMPELREAEWTVEASPPDLDGELLP